MSRILQSDPSVTMRPLPPIEPSTWVIFGQNVPKLDPLPPEDQERWRKNLARLAAQCGCHEGASTATVVIAGYALVCSVSEAVFSYWIAVLFFVLGACAGKLFGMARAKSKCDRALNTLREEIATCLRAGTSESGPA